tara:strand:- start:1399 stop:2427 length:1029 start_codon:yes stop_codon:yes gene_type:complete
MNVLMTGAGAPGGPGIIKCLKKNKNVNLLVADIDIQASGRFLNSKFIQIPKPSEISFIQTLLEICEKNSIDIIFPLVTKELEVLSYNKEKFEKRNIKLIVSEYESLKISNNKSALYNHLSKNGILTPSYKIINNYSEFIKTSSHFLNNYDGYCIKPSISNGSRGVRIINNSVDKHDLLFNHKPNSLYTSQKDLEEVLRTKEFPELLISEILPGDEYTIDSIIDNQGNPILIVPRIRTRIREGISLSGKFIKNDDIINYSKSILDTLKLLGPIGIQIKKDINGDFKVLEINPRIQGTSVAALGAGVNLPMVAVNSILGRPTGNLNINWGIEFSRYYDEVFFKL